MYPAFTELDVFGSLQWLDWIFAAKAMTLTLIGSSLEPVSTSIANKTEQTVRRQTPGLVE
jgi:uncharacterized protein YqcC (DUF446 family)